ncbi:DUF6098 family protein [Bogoriella caseilytica]|uniref:Uncharacterized protein n=1 Tax=Bogoriella caseilytica TaxID=56055 RepID=A0A3N2BEZ6_9MICO|nr:DUF6098 family protein [Bogoriella caseilytica]ROR73827.1 hypothetical protein EDD31_2217 [Bogoriella caseilytica]
MNSAATPASSPPLRSIGQIVLLMQTVGPLYLHVPDPHSIGSRDGEFRDPESTFRLPGAPAWSLQPESWWLDSTATWVARRLARHATHAATAPAPTLLSGEIVSWGIDGQPLIGGHRTVAFLDADVFVEAQATYSAWRETALPRGSRSLRADTSEDFLLEESGHDSTESR